MKRIFLIILIIFLVIFNSMPSYGFTVKDLEGIDSGQEWKIEQVGQGVIKVVSTIGSICSVVVLIVIGIKYMLGSTEEKAEYKKTLFPYVIGGFLVFGASVIASAIYNIAINL